MYSDQEFQVKDHSSLHAYRTEIPNIIDELNLDPYAYRLYCYYKKVAGDSGACFQKKKTIEEKTGMSTTVIKDRTKILAAPFEELGGKPLIKVTSRKGTDGNNLPTLIEVEDIWPENFKILSTRFSGAPPSVAKKPTLRRQTTTEEDLLELDPSKKLFVADGAERPPASKIKIRVNDGKSEEISQDDLFRRAVNSRKSWGTEEIQYAWGVLAEYGGIVYDWFRFIEGTIEKYRNQLKSQTISRGKKSCKKKNTQESYKESSTEKDTSEQLYLNSGEYLMSLLKGSHNGTRPQTAS